jgi:preprotein translocase subunit SecY
LGNFFKYWDCIFFLVRPVVFDWNLGLAIEIILSLTTGSILSLWFAELITEEGIGNGSSMLIFINIVGSIPNNFSQFGDVLFKNFQYSNLLTIFQGSIFYILVVTLVIIFQDSYKKVGIVSAKQLNVTDYTSQNLRISEFSNSYIPLKVNQGGIMPLVFSSTIALLFVYPLQLLLNAVFSLNSSFVNTFLSVYSVGINVTLVIFFSGFYASLVLKPRDISQNLAKLTYSIPGIRQGKETTKFLEKTIARLAFVAGLFLAFLAFFPLLIGNFIQGNIFRNVTSLLILVGVITDVTSQMRGFLVIRRYEGLNQLDR